MVEHVQLTEMSLVQVMIERQDQSSYINEKMNISALFHITIDLHHESRFTSKLNIFLTQ